MPQSVIYIMLKKTVKLIQTETMNDRIGCASPNNFSQIVYSIGEYVVVIEHLFSGWLKTQQLQ